MADESTIGLLLKAHAQCAAQAHGEQYVFDNISASAQYSNAGQFIESAIKALGFAEMYVARQGDRKKRTDA